MNHLYCICLLLLSSSTSWAACRQLVDGFCVDEIARYDITRGKVAKIDALIQLGTTLKVQVPPGAPIDPRSFVIGSKAFAYRFDEPTSPTAFFIWPRTPKRGTVAGQQTNVQLEIAGESVIIKLKASPTQGVGQIIIGFPQLQAEQARADGLRARIRAEIEEELANARANIGQTSKTLAESQIMTAALQRLTCSKAPERGFDRALILTSKRICAFGEWIFIEVTLRNGRRKDFELREVTAHGLWDGEPKTLDFNVRWVAPGPELQPAQNPLKLRFDETVRGMFLIRPPQGELPDAYRITVKERGGLKRLCIADDIEF